MSAITKLSISSSSRWVNEMADSTEPGSFSPCYVNAINFAVRSVLTVAPP